MQLIRQRQIGITTLQVLIILVVLGASAAAVLQVMRMRAENLVRESVAMIQSVATALQSYQSLYDQLAGDDGPIALLSTRGEHWVPVVAGDADGNLEIPADRTFTGVAESGALWQQLRAAALFPGDASLMGQEALPVNAWGGLVGITTAPVGGDLEGTKICFSAVPGAAALALDRELDDGLGASGNLRSTLVPAAANPSPVNMPLAEPYDRGEIYTLCYRLEI